MLFQSTLLACTLLASTTSAAPIQRREVPQEHSHEPILTSVRASLASSNPLGLVDPVFGLLGNAAAAAGLGKFTGGADCLQQATADQAFSNAKAAKDVAGMTNALIYRALERNTGKVGLASVTCTAVKAVNPEIAAVSQHQDPASANAAATNKAIVLALAQQISSVGGNPQDALKSGTFAPGNVNDNTGKGNTCDVATDPNGCIFTQKLLVADATAAEIAAVVQANGGAAAAPAAAPAAVAAAAPAPAVNAVQGTLVQSAAVSFGKCPTPQIIGAVGLDGRTEFAFQPADKTSYNHGSAQGIQIITQFICDTLVNTCGASTAAHDLCTKTQAAVGSGKNDGGLADKFNAGFGLKTNFAAAKGSIPAGAAAPAAGTGNTAAAQPAPAKAAAPVKAAAPAQAAPAVTGNLITGSCIHAAVTGGLLNDTAACKADTDCASQCCGTDGKCHEIEALQAAVTCKNGRVSHFGAQSAVILKGTTNIVNACDASPNPKVIGTLAA